ncbi:MAG: hypothetical protein H0U75_03805 [Legionella sp.]|nr:hypothetical protein [Legionella sp.]
MKININRSTTIIVLLLQFGFYLWSLNGWAQGLTPAESTTPASTNTSQTASSTKADSSAQVSNAQVSSARSGGGSFQVATAEKGLSAAKDPNYVEFAPIGSLDINIEARYVNSPEIKKLRSMLGIRKPYRTIFLVDSQPLGRFNLNDNIISVQPRSFVGILDYLSNGVEVSHDALEQGLVLAPKNAHGEFFDLNTITRGIFKVCMSTKRPRGNVNVAVYYRNHWFYIMDDDLSTKRTLALVQQVFNFLSGTTDTHTTNPILTIPVR